MHRRTAPYACNHGRPRTSLCCTCSLTVLLGADVRRQKEGGAVGARAAGGVPPRAQRLPACMLLPPLDGPLCGASFDKSCRNPA